MSTWSLALLISAIVIAVVLGVLYLIPQTRAFARSWWPAFVVAMLAAVSAALILVGKKRSRARENTTRAQMAAKERITDIRIEEAVKRTQAMEERKDVEVALSAINQAQNVFLRLRQKALLLEKIQEDNDV